MTDLPPTLEHIIDFALEEDLAFGDVTTDTTIAPDARAKAILVGREELVLAGLPIFQKVFWKISAETVFEAYFCDGDRVPAGEKICLLNGPLRAMLQAERAALNFLQRMTGIATLTRQYVDRVAPYGAKVLDTRKTAPGLRWLDKYAVRAGGGCNHRFGLFDGVLIKDNHIAGAGSISKAVKRARAGATHMLKIEVEVEDLAGVEEALAAGADIILLDNMTPPQMAEAVRVSNGRAVLEASGGMHLDTVEEVAKAGVKMISVGALTHSARAADLSLEIVSKGP